MLIKRKILTWQAALVATACLITSLTALRQMTTSLAGSQLDKLAVIAQDKADQIASLISDKSRVIERLGTGQEIADYAKTYNDPALVQYLNRFADEFPVLAYVTEDGIEEVKIVNGKRTEQLEDLSETALFQDALWERNRVRVALDTRGGDPSALALGFAICRQSYFDTCEGVLIGRLPLSDILTVMRKGRIDRTGFVTIVDDQGRTLFDPQPEKLLQTLTAEDEASKKLLDLALSLHTGHGRATLAGVDGYVAFHPVARQRWAVIATLPYREFMVAPTALRDTAVAVSVTVLIVCLIASAVVASTITRGLGKLTTVTEALGTGDLSQRVVLRSRDEIGKLGKVFNHMAERLQGTVEKLNTEIQDREKAQAEAARANDQLRQMQSDLVQSEKMGVLGNLAAGVAHEINTPTGAILNVSVDTLDHLQKLVQLEMAMSDLPADTRQWLRDVLATLSQPSPAADHPAAPARRRELEQQLRGTGVRDSRRLAEVSVSYNLANPAEDPRLLQHLAHKAVVEFPEHVAALKAAAEISTSSARKIARIVRALSFYSRDTRGAVADIQVNEGLEDTLAILRNRLKHHAEIRTYFEKDLPLVRCGPELAQVWTNILSNACDAIELARGEGLGKIEITTAAAPDGCVVITLTNDGPRIPEDILDKVFDPFFTTKPQGKGMGLGLSICAGIVRRAGGAITARNEPDRVVFQVILPAAGKEDVATCAAAHGWAREGPFEDGNFGPVSSGSATG
ncbi:MAG: ATP-binding protein [Phycisphaerae bacterium]|nr:ATP-binding protein [Phycisphaerae bacterium]